jgi:hypothetical protein
LLAGYRSYTYGHHQAAHFRGSSGALRHQLAAYTRERHRHRPYAIVLQLAYQGDGWLNSVVITPIKSDHSIETVDGNVSNHSAGRAMAIGAVDGQICPGTPTGRCANLFDDPAAAVERLRRAPGASVS